MTSLLIQTADFAYKSVQTILFYYYCGAFELCVY